MISVPSETDSLVTSFSLLNAPLSADGDDAAPVHTDGSDGSLLPPHNKMSESWCDVVVGKGAP
jgi:hypothetical protein